MKTAEEWVNKDNTKLQSLDYPISLYNLTISHESEHDESKLIDFVQQIQLEAYKAGMTRAAEIAADKSNFHLDGMEGADWKEFVTEEAFYAQAYDLSNHILTARDELKELP